MALVLSINPFCEPEADSPPSIYQPVWESQHCNKSCISNLSPQEGNTPGLKEEAHYRRATDHTMDHVTLSRVSFFKRKLVEDEEPALSFRSYCRTVSPMLEERAHVLHLSLEKLRFLDDPESFLRRSVLINNLLRRLRNEILLQSDWCFSPGPMSTPHPLQSPATSTSPLPAPALPPCMTPHGPFRKRLRLLRREGAECMPACCCLYAAGHYLQLPLSVYERPVYPNSLPSSSSSTTRFPQLLEVEEEEEDSDEEEELDSLCPMITLCHAEAREQNRTRDGLRPQNHREVKRSEKGREKERAKADGEKLSHGRISDATGSRLQSDQIRAQVKGK